MIGTCVVLGGMSVIMEVVGKKKARRPRRRFTSEFKAEIVELCRRGDRSVHQVAVDFDLVHSAVRRWLEEAEAAEAEAEAGPRTSTERLAREEKAELAALRRENAVLRRDVEILKRATAFFAKETR